jgi:hypothetical protein
LPLLQLLSVTGLWGIVLLMSWFASLVSWAWELGFARSTAVVLSKRHSPVLRWSETVCRCLSVVGGAFTTRNRRRKTLATDAVARRINRKPLEENR